MKKQEYVPHINVDYFHDLTGEISAEGPTATEGVGERIKRMREDKNISLEELSKLTGFSVQELRDIEAGNTQPRLGIIQKLSKALDIALDRLFSDVGSQLYSITRKDERQLVNREKKQKLKYMSLCPEVKGRHMEALIVELDEDDQQDLSVHEGEEFIYVLEGSVKLNIGENQHELQAGDSVYYLSTIPHKVSALGDKAVILAVLYG